MARTNGGHPAIAATPRPAAFNGSGVVGARGINRSPGAAPRTLGQQGQPRNFVRTPGQPTGARAQGQPAQGQAAQTNGARQPKAPKAQRARPEERKTGEREK
jgi:hypothetical protein